MFAIVHLYFARCTTATISPYSIKPFRAEILQNFQLLFWKIVDFIDSFRLNLTFNMAEQGDFFLQTFSTFVAGMNFGHFVINFQMHI